MPGAYDLAPMLRCELDLAGLQRSAGGVTMAGQAQVLKGL